MNDLDKRAFEHAYCRLKAPAALKADTLEKMLRENEKCKEIQRKEKSGKGKKKVFYYGALAALLCVAVLSIIVLRPEGISYVTPMEEGVYYEEVELKNGVIHFVRSRVSISITPNAGSAGIGQEGEAALEEVTRQEEIIETESGGRLVFRERDTASVPDIKEDDWSYIGEQKIYVTVLDAEKTGYQAVFEKAGSTYEITGEDITQKEFIDELYRRVTE